MKLKSEDFTLLVRYEDEEHYNKWKNIIEDSLVHIKEQVGNKNCKLTITKWL